METSLPPSLSLTQMFLCPVLLQMGGVVYVRCACAGELCGALQVTPFKLSKCLALIHEIIVL